MPEHARRLARLAALAAVALVLWLFVWPTVWGGSMTYITVSGPSMEPLYASGDFVAARERSSYEAGDIVVFTTGQGKVIHRIVGGDGVSGYVMQGDNNPEVDRWTPTDEDVLGSVVLHIPRAGDAIMLARDVLITPPFPYLLAGFVFLVVALGGDSTKKRKDVQPGPAADRESANV